MCFFRILVQHVGSLAPFKRFVEWHMAHEFSKEMSTKSNVVRGFVILFVGLDKKYVLKVPLGVLLFNENKTDEMCSIMKGLQKYVSKTTYQLTYHLTDGNDFVVNEDCVHRILFGGNQLTVYRSRGSQSARCSDNVSDDRLDALLLVTEDWHARMTLMRVRWVLINNCSEVCYSYRLFGNTCFQINLPLKEVLFIS